jgi:hypothetical protein
MQTPAPSQFESLPHGLPVELGRQIPSFAQ